MRYGSPEAPLRCRVHTTGICFNTKSPAQEWKINSNNQISITHRPPTPNGSRGRAAGLSRAGAARCPHLVAAADTKSVVINPPPPRINPPPPCRRPHPPLLPSSSSWSGSLTSHCCTASTATARWGGSKCSSPRPCCVIFGCVY